MEKILQPPIKDFEPSTHISQMFGVNRALYRRNFNIPGHNAIDVKGNDPRRGFGTPILAAHNGTVESVSYDVPHKTKGNGVYILDESGEFSTNYWHLASFEVKVGDNVEAGDVIGTMGNSGFVFPKPTPACPHCGTHLHFGCRIHGKNNDYSGFVDPLQFMHKEGWKYNIRFTSDMFYGVWGDNVSWLQTILKIELGTTDYEPLGYFGYRTLRDVIALQKRHGIQPAFGYVGRITRSYLNSTYSKYGN